MHEILIESVMIILLVMSVIVSFSAILMIVARSSFLSDISMDALRKGSGINENSKKSGWVLCFDQSVRIFDAFFASFGLIMLAPVFGICAGALRLFGEKQVFIKKEIIGKRGKKARLYRFNTAINETTDGLRLKNVKRLLNRTAFYMLPEIAGIALGCMSLYGLSRIAYSEKEVIEVCYPEIMEQYDQYLPGLVDLYAFERRVHGNKKSQSERLEDIRFCNGVFLQKRSWKLIAKMFVATMVSAINE